MNTATQTKSNTTDRPFHYQKQHLNNYGIETNCDDEDAPRRVSASNYAAAFNALMLVSGIRPEFWHGLHVLLDKTRGFSQDKPVQLSDTEAGALLPGNSDVSGEAKAKRWKRFWDGYDGKQHSEAIHYDGFEDEQRRLNKRLAYREAGTAIKQTKFDQPKLIPSRYKSSLAQMVVDISRRASNLIDTRRNGKKLTRRERFEEAAKIVWNLLPGYDDLSTKKIKQEARKPVRSKKNRSLNRFLKAASEMIADANDSDERERLRTRLHAELETLFADQESDEETPENATSDEIILQNHATFSDENCENIEQNERFLQSRGDNVVHPQSDFEKDKIPPEFAALGVIYLSPDRKEVIM